MPAEMVIARPVVSFLPGLGPGLHAPLQRLVLASVELSFWCGAMLPGLALMVAESERANLSQP